MMGICDGDACVFRPVDGLTAREWRPRLKPEVLAHDLSDIGLEWVHPDNRAVRVWAGEVVTVAAVLPRGHDALVWHRSGLGPGGRVLLVMATRDLTRVDVGAPMVMTTPSLEEVTSDEGL